MESLPKAFVPGYEHDVFVSYASVDDMPNGMAKVGWVSQLVEDVKTRLAQKLGRSDIFSIWQDAKLAKNVDFESQILRTLENTATLLVVMSPGYLASDWCRREREVFLKFVHDRLDSGSRVFLVNKEELERNADRPDEFGKPDEFVNLLGYKFWKKDGVSSPQPLDPTLETDKGSYRDLVNQLAFDLADTFKLLRKRAEQTATALPSPPPPAVSATVFLAEVTDDLVSRRAKVRSYLEQFGARVLPTEPLPTGDVSALRTILDETLPRCRLFVQLLSVLPGKAVRDTKLSLALLQHQRAAALEIPIVQWRDANLTEQSFVDQNDGLGGEVDIAAFRSLLFGPTVQAAILEDFKSQVQQRLSGPVKQPLDDAGPLGGSIVFVHFHPKTEDRALAGDLAGYLDQHGYAVVKTYEGPDADPQSLREEFEHSVLESHGLILVYGDQRAHLWARGQLREINKLICEHERSLKALAVGVGPPQKQQVLKDPLGFSVPNMHVLDMQNGIDIDKLKTFLDALDKRSPNPKRGKPVPAAS